MSYSLEHLNRLNQIHTDKDIKALSYAIFPGTHCPLFGVALTASYIQKLGMIVVGTGECTYYTKHFAYHRQEGHDQVYSLVLKDQDVVFGASEKVKKAVKEIAEMEELEAVMIVSTCVPELIGEDYSAIKEELEEALKIPVLTVQTEHFKCNTHIPGMVRTLGALSELMEDWQDEKEGVNILGHRQGNIAETELMTLLAKYNIGINCAIPSSATIENLKTASKVKLNIVTDQMAITLAEEMKKRFGIPFIYFGKAMDKAQLQSLYKTIQETLEIDLTEDLAPLEREYNALVMQCKERLEGKKLIYGNTPMMAFETVDFLTDLGLEPIFIQVRELYDVDVPFKERLIQKGFNPYVSRIANIAPLRTLYGAMGGDIYVGHESPVLLKQHGLTQMTFDNEAQNIGYSLPIAVMKHILFLVEGGHAHGNV